MPSLVMNYQWNQILQFPKHTKHKSGTCKKRAYSFNCFHVRFSPLFSLDLFLLGLEHIWSIRQICWQTMRKKDWTTVIQYKIKQDKLIIKQNSGTITQLENCEIFNMDGQLQNKPSGTEYPWPVCHAHSNGSPWRTAKEKKTFLAFMWRNPFF